MDVDAENTMIYGVCSPANNAGTLGLENLRSAFARMHRRQPRTIFARASMNVNGRGWLHEEGEIIVLSSSRRSNFRRDTRVVAVSRKPSSVGREYRPRNLEKAVLPAVSPERPTEEFSLSLVKDELATKNANNICRLVSIYFPLEYLFLR